MKVIDVTSCVMFTEQFADYCNRLETTTEWGGQLEVSVMLTVTCHHGQINVAMCLCARDTDCSLGLGPVIIHFGL